MSGSSGSKRPPGPPSKPPAEAPSEPPPPAGADDQAGVRPTPVRASVGAPKAPDAPPPPREWTLETPEGAWRARAMGWSCMGRKEDEAGVLVLVALRPDDGADDGDWTREVLVPARSLDDVDPAALLRAVDRWVPFKGVPEPAPKEVRKRSGPRRRSGGRRGRGTGGRGSSSP